MAGLTRAARLTWQAGPFLTSAFALATLLSAVAPVVTAWLTKSLLDLVVDGAASSEIIVVVVQLAAAGLFASVLPFALLYAQKETERRVGLIAQERLFAATERHIGVARLEDPAFLDTLRMALQQGGATPGLLLSTALSAARTVLMALGFLGSLVVLAFWLPLVAVGAALPVLAAELWIAKRRARVQWELGPTERREIFFRELLTNLQAAKEIRLFGIGGYLRSKMTELRRDGNAVQSRMDRSELVAQAFAGVLSAVAAGAALLWAVLAAAGGGASVGDISLLVASLTAVQIALTALMRDVGNSHQQILMFRSYLEVVDGEVDLPVSVAPAAVVPLRDRIEFRDVWFRYGEDQPWVLQGLDLSIARGHTIGIVGRNGAGKSTLIKLLCRMYDPTRGSILWDGVDIRDMDPVALRARIGVVFQDYMKYDLTAAENIGLGDLANAGDRDMIEAAARNAGAHGFLSELPRAYDTLLSRIFFQGDWRRGAAGVTLSGGQWQRVALARAYVRGRRDLLILDEPSSGLDAEAEHEIHRDLTRHRADRTSVLISHRLGAVREADTVVVLDRGQIVEQGSHDQLIVSDGLYAQLFEMQARGYQDNVMEPR